MKTTYMRKKKRVESSFAVIYIKAPPKGTFPLQTEVDEKETEYNLENTLFLT